jgi:hypothetical protein
VRRGVRDILRRGTSDEVLKEPHVLGSGKADEDRNRRVDTEFMEGCGVDACVVNNQRLNFWKRYAVMAAAARYTRNYGLKHAGWSDIDVGALWLS